MFSEWNKEWFVDGPLDHLLEQHRDLKATMALRKRGLKIAAWCLLGVYALFLVIGLVGGLFSSSEIRASGKYSISFGGVIFVGLALILFAIFLFCNYAFIKRPQARYAHALADAHPGLDLDDEASIQAVIWERWGHPDSFLPRLYNWLVWKSREKALSPVEQVVKDVWYLDDINAEVFELGVHVSPVEDVERIERGIASFRAIGADEAADIWVQALPMLKRVNANVFPADPSEQLEDWEEAELYDQLGELNEQLYDLEDQTHALLYDYVMKHRAEFVSGQATDAASEVQP